MKVRDRPSGELEKYVGGDFDATNDKRTNPEQIGKINRPGTRVAQIP